ncbi:transmembrane protein 98-like [Agrilus planipennis]|uniref:Transmembrane protein 98 n=1 Tax=Agrilus planipennis TaxID=224129 RepID=A0A1W4W633_AGRPL|nr:transmembrane protein 98 [Agrilus planipennis]XP_025829422.1 transmembrane protein 98-like [Agrilus planipennis]
MNPEYTEMIAAIAIGVLSAIFLSAFIVLILICRRQKLYYKSKLCENDDFSTRPEVMLIEPEKPEILLNEVTLNPNLEQILTDEQWVDDATGLIPHCLSILKTCRFLTERLTALAMRPMNSNGTGLSQIIDCAKRISSRVDDVVRSMYPPLDPRLLEARTAALTLAVTQLALITRYECGQKEKNLSWIDKSLAQMDGHVLVLREAALTQEASNKIQNATNTLLA